MVAESFKKVPFLGRRKMAVESRKKESGREDGVVNASEMGVAMELSKIERAERKALDENGGTVLNSGANRNSSTDRNSSYIAWMFSVRHQRGLESLLFHHRYACVVVLSETIELDFFKDSFVKDGYKYYATHYSELVRLAALYKYGGIYLDSDIVVLKSLSSLSNCVGKEDRLAGGSLNGAVMAFKRNSTLNTMKPLDMRVYYCLFLAVVFMMECLKEFYMTYDDTRLRWNGADLLTRVARRFLSIRNRSVRQLELNVQPSFMFFPIAPQNISRYFTAPTTETEKAQQDVLFRKILNESFTFHFWNSFTSSLIPEPQSLATRLIDHPCIRCSDVL
ncbi:hypothetical protein M0R45_013952 [Rubus argutus]|uniref:Alpha 1,4-glycosyltransferase domain-containing protein n=1 Tax=Rubus argutus TaxID=59490 RepID=A0AAW1XNI5_RUBAR